MKAVIFARVSSKEQEETGYSLDAQVKLLNDYAKQRNFEIAKVFRISESASGKQIRTVFEQMLKHATTHAVPIILCEKIDRLTRNLKDAATVNDWVQESSDRELHFVKESFVVSRRTKAHENLVWDMKVAIARFYTNNLSEEVKKGQAEKIRQGWFPSRPPLGYKTQGEKGHKIHVIDEEKAYFVRSAFQRYSTGDYSLTALRDLLYEEGLRTRGSNKLSKSRLADILGDPFYQGSLRWNDVIHHGVHEPLVSKELWEKVQAVLRGKTAPHYKRHLFSFTKLIKCGDCGGTISGEIQKGHIYYSCKHAKTCSQRGGTREEEIESQLINVLQIFESITPEEADEIYARVRASHQGEIEYKESVLKTLNDRYLALQRMLDILYDDRLAEKITQERWEEKQRSINREQSEIRSQIERLKSEETKYFELYINILDLARRAREIYAKATPEQRRRLLVNIFSNLSLKDKKVAYSLKKPVAVLSKRIQERLDAKIKFEPEKTLTPQGRKGSSVPQLKPLLRG